MPSVKATLGRRATARALGRRWHAEVADYATDAQWSRDGAVVAVACAEGTVMILDGTTGAVRHRLSGHAGGALRLSWSAPSDAHGVLAHGVLAHGVLASAGQDGVARLWNPVTGACLAELDAAGVDVTLGVRRAVPWAEHLAWSPAGDRLATAAGRELRVWTADGHLVRRHPAAASTVSALAWRQPSHSVSAPSTASAARLSAASYGGAVLYGDERGPLDAQGLAVVERRFDWRGSFLTMAWSPNGRVLAAGMQESAIHLWVEAAPRRTGADGSYDSGYDDLEMRGYPTKVRELSWSSDGKLLATGGGADVTVWSFAGKGPAGSRPRQLRGHVLAVTDLAFHRRGSLLASGGEDGQLLVWDLTRSINAPSGECLTPCGVSRVAWHPRERVVLAAYASGRVAAWELPW
jgi:WD40 repeat protein